MSPSASSRRMEGARPRRCSSGSLPSSAAASRVGASATAATSPRRRGAKASRPQRAQRAVRHYFQPGNLTALRELALRRTAQRVDQQMRSYMRAHAISGPWAAGERVLVCVSEDPACAGLIRYTKRLADRLDAPWTALYVETARYHRLDERERDRIADCLPLADKPRGPATTIPGARILPEVVGHPDANNLTHIVIGKS